MEIQTLKIADLPGGIFCLNHELKILTWNAEMERITGWKAPEVLGKASDFLPLYDQQQHPLDFVGCLKANNISNRNVLLKTVYNTYKPVFIQARIVAAPQSTAFYAIFLVNDLSHIITCDQIPERSETEAHFHNLIGRDKKMLEIYRMIQLAAESISNTFVNGESGTGKELIARAIHELSDRKEGPFVVVNCSALSEGLLESELFGHVKGAFTGAIQGKIGKFETAQNGTIFLDEIGDISPAIQLKLLRVIQEKTVVRVGSNEELKVDMRIITATNRDLRHLVESGEFREDLFYRLKVFTILTVPLREKPGDLPILIRHFIEQYNRRTGKRIKDLTNDAYRILLEYCWPGNVRELENAVEHAYVLCEGEYIDVFDLPLEMRSYNFRDRYCRKFVTPQSGEVTAQLSLSPNGAGLKPADSASAGNPVTQPPGMLHPLGTGIVPAAAPPSGNREELLSALQQHNWSRTRTAAALGISRVALWKKMKKLQINAESD